MKKLLLALSIFTLVGCTSASEKETVKATSTPTIETTAETITDTVTSASSTRIHLEGDDFNSAIDELVSISNDLATKAETEVEGYEEPASGVAQVMSINSDEYVSMSTIHAWKVEKDGDEATIKVVMTDGKTISNLIAKGAKGTILVHGSAYYLMHVENVETVTLEYSDENYEAGLFNSAYSGKDAKLNEYTVTFRINELEKTFVYMFD